MIDAAETGSVPWEPKNFDGTFDGPIRIRTALTKSKNLVSIRILQAITPAYAQDYITRFGFDPKQHPPYSDHGAGRGLGHPAGNGDGLLGVRQRRLPSGAVFHYAGGRRERAGAGQGRAGARRRGRPAHDRQPQRVRDVQHDAGRDPRRHRRARHVSRSDSTWPARPARPTTRWTPGLPAFSAISPAWCGSDSTCRARLEPNETGAVAALPIWISYMAMALKNVPEESPAVPEGVIAARINPETGLRDPSREKSIIEYFYHENLPPEEESVTESGACRRSRGGPKTSRTRSTDPPQ